MDESKEVWERLTAAEQGIKSAHHRLDSLEKLTQSVSDMVGEVKHMREDLNAVKGDVDVLKAKPARRYELIVTCLISAIVGGFGTYIITMILK